MSIDHKNVLNICVTNARRAGDKNPDSSILADTMKLLGNSAYGKTLENLGAHRHNKYVQETSKLINNPLFHKQTPIDETCFEVEIGKKKINWNLPLQIGFFVYQYAKLRMLEFYYDCLLKYIDKADFELCEMDTDSYYFAISANSLEEVVIPSKRLDFFSNYHRWFPAQACDNHRNDFIETKCSGGIWDTQQRCCQDRFTSDRRTPGLMKIEWSGDGCIALTSKTYFCFSSDANGGENNIKSASKGLSKRHIQLSKHLYYNVLESKESGKGINIGFRADGTKIQSYRQERAALSYLYIKRKVQNDGISTEPLDV